MACSRPSTLSEHLAFWIRMGTGSSLCRKSEMLLPSVSGAAFLPNLNLKLEACFKATTGSTGVVRADDSTYFKGFGRSGLR
jgi:hypothetical protein